MRLTTPCKPAPPWRQTGIEVSWCALCFAMDEIDRRHHPRVPAQQVRSRLALVTPHAWGHIWGHLLALPMRKSSNGKA
jgi:hypothetical protein